MTPNELLSGMGPAMPRQVEPIINGYRCCAECRGFGKTRGYVGFCRPAPAGLLVPLYCTRIFQGNGAKASAIADATRLAQQAEQHGGVH